MKKEIYLPLLFVLLITLSAASSDSPQNVTLKMELDAEEIYVDGEKAEEKTYRDLEIPYIVSNQPLGILSYTDFQKISYISGSTDNISVTQSAGTFLLPNTEGGFKEIEDEKEALINKEFLNRIKPSFNYPKKTKSVVRVRMQPDIEIESNKKFPKNGEIGIRNKGGLVELSAD